MSNWKAVLFVIVPIVVGACTGSAAGQPGGQTSTPVTTTPSPSVAATGAPTSGTTLHIAALNIAFDTNHLAAPAAQPFVIDFANNDPGVPHNIDVTDATGKSVFVGQVVTGPTTVSYQLPALAPGTYQYHCDVHPEMTGTLTVG